VHRPSRLLAICAVVASLASACTGKNAVSDGSDGPQLRALAQADANHVLPVGDRPRAPKMHGETLYGEPLDIASLRGKVVVVNFWAAWCPPCRRESSSLVKVEKDTAALGVEFVGIDFKDDRSAARRFVEVHDVPYPSLYDQPGVILTRMRKLVPQVPPSTMVLDRSGRIAALFIGPVTETTLAGSVRALAQET
jgi:thiol-disulfide isomerase/thioredoxin